MVNFILFAKDLPRRASDRDFKLPLCRAGASISVVCGQRALSHVRRPRDQEARKARYTGCLQLSERLKEWSGFFGSFRLNARELDHLAPLLDLVGNKFPKFGWSHRHRVSA
jgi:hypothetical protein